MTSRLLAGLLLVALSGCNMVRGPQKDHECRGTLRTIIGLEQAFYSEHHRFSTHPVEVGFAPSRGNRYLYLFDAVGPVSRRDALPSPPLIESVGVGPDTRERGVTVEQLRPKVPPEVLAQLGLSGDCPDCSLTVACVANLDEDDDVDVWSMSTKDRPEAQRGSLVHHLKD
jgi:hypothetical protein